MTTNVTADELRQHKDRCLHIIEVDKALTRLEANNDFKLVQEYIFKETLLNHVQIGFNLNGNNEYAKQNIKLAKAISRVGDFIKNLHAVAEHCEQDLQHIDNDILEAEAEE